MFRKWIFPFSAGSPGLDFVQLFSAFLLRFYISSLRHLPFFGYVCTLLLYRQNKDQQTLQWGKLGPWIMLMKHLAHSLTGDINNRDNRTTSKLRNCILYILKNSWSIFNHISWKFKKTDFKQNWTRLSCENCFFSKVRKKMKKFATNPLEEFSLIFEEF